MHYMYNLYIYSYIYALYIWFLRAVVVGKSALRGATPPPHAFAYVLTNYVIC